MPVVEAIGWIGSAVLIISLLQTRVMRFRVLNTLSCLVLIGYNAVVEVWPMAAMNVVLVGINLWVISRLVRERHDERAYDVVPIGVDQPYLRHLLSRHSQDIRAFNPDLPDDGVPVADHAFLVSTGDQLVGVVLSRAGQEVGEQQVVLDYVLPAYRDFTPGEFVFRTDGPFAAMGTRRVVASAGMAASEKYLRAVGFVAQGDRRVLELVDA
ncbi:YgjV family protein [Actinotalea sp. K2]|uniref:YgjV family protein n=1 Tax=Actinotalea sp. K2 TaxID=2939438 RepID=UPI002016B6BD|nr:YgjV family protein [Actinotalea sp. K2]MCL3860104.1 YgjV family protein [Actinotalea sp. K2]